MTARTPIILAIVVLLLAGYVFFFERDRPGRSEIEARSGFLIESLVRDRLSRIEVSSGDAHMAMSREGEHGRSSNPSKRQPIPSGSKITFETGNSPSPRAPSKTRARRMFGASASTRLKRRCASRWDAPESP